MASQCIAAAIASAGRIRKHRPSLPARPVLSRHNAQIGPEAINVGMETSVAAKVSQAVQTASGNTASAADHLVGKTVAEVERDLIVRTLDKCLGNRTHAANILGISIRTLRNKLKQYAEEGVPIPAGGE